MTRAHIGDFKLNDIFVTYVTCVLCMYVCDSPVEISFRLLSIQCIRLCDHINFPVLRWLMKNYFEMCFHLKAGLLFALPIPFPLPFLSCSLLYFKPDSCPRNARHLTNDAVVKWHNISGKNYRYTHLCLITLLLYFLYIDLDQFRPVYNIKIR